MVKPRENRVPIMMSDDELTVVDDWRFANRVGTRSEAIRRLCQIAIRLETLLPHLKSLLRDQANSQYELFERLEEAQNSLAALPTNADSGEIRRVAAAGLEGINRAFHLSDSPSMDVTFVLKNVADAFDLLTSTKPLESSLEEMKSRASVNEDTRKALKEHWEPKS